MKLLYRIVAAVTIFQLAFAPPALYAQSSGQQPEQAGETVTLEEALAQVDRAFDLIAQLSEAIDTSAYDLDAISDELSMAADPAEIVDWVQANIAFEAYAGLLRGERGTVLSRAGNALDQAVLLAGLIKDAGFDARIARGSLTTDQAAALVDRMAVPVQPVPETSLASYKSVLREMIASGDVPPEAAQSMTEILDQMPDTLAPTEVEIPEVVNVLSDALLEAIEGHTSFDPEAMMAAIVEEARDYYWVEYRTTAGGDWTPAHPVYAARDEGPGEVATTETFASTIPEVLQHRVRVEVLIEQRVGDQIRQSPIMPAWERPAANMAGIPVAFFNQPDGVTIDNIRNAGSFEAALDSTKFFVPVFDGAVQADSRFFGLDGFAGPADVAGTPFSEIFLTVGGGLSDATTALSGLGSAGDGAVAAALVGQIMRITMIAPGGEERQIERVVWREDATQPRDESAIKEALATKMTMMVAVGRQPEDAALAQWLDNLLSRRAVATSAFRAVYAETPEETDRVLRRMPPDVELISHLVAYSIFDTGAASLLDLSYRASSNIVVLREQLFSQKVASLSVDILSNYRRSFMIDSSGKILPDFINSVRAGVLESYAEQFAIGGGITSVDIFRAAREAEIPIQTFTQTTIDRISELDQSIRIRESLISDVESGYAVIIPEGLPDNVDYFAWMRINLETGETLGFLEPGIGGAISSYFFVANVSAETLLMIGFFFITGLKFYTCIKNLERSNPYPTSDNRLGCFLQGLSHGGVLVAGAGVATLGVKFGIVVAVVLGAFQITGEDMASR